MAHDFNNLLTAILGSAELIGADVPPEASMRQDIEAIRKAAERGRDLIRKLLGFTRQEPLSLRRVHLRDHLREFVDVLRRVVRESVEMDVVFGEDEPAVLVDPGALEQVLLNLITNARDAVTAGGRITIQTGRSVMDQDFCAGHGWGTPGEYGTLIVSDTGVGMPPEVRRRVFEPFFTTKPVGAGTGLGMSLVYGLVRQQNGHVQVYSEVGRGTVVRVYLPATVEPEPRTIVAPSTPAPRASNESILLVEDEEWVRKVAQKVLLRHGYRVVLASDGAEALEIVRKSEAFDLIVSDVVMPNMGGPQLQVELQREGRNPKILFTSGYTDRDIAHAASLPPDAPFLSKPWTIDEFLSRVREVLNA
jgi:CheY-like chemotaxis protein